MSNEELVSSIQAGDRALLPELWTHVERFAAQRAGRRARALNGAGGVTAEDLYQAGYLALVDAVEGYDPTQGMAFIGWYHLHLLTAFSDAAGYRTSRQRKDPLHSAASLDAPLGDEDGGVLEDVVPDGGRDFEDMEERIWRAQLRAELDRALDALLPTDADTIRRRFYQGQTLAAISKEAGVGQERIRQRQVHALRALRNPKISRSLKEFIEEQTPYYLHVGVSRFHSTGTSAVEEIVFRRDSLADNLGREDRRL